MRRIFVVLGPGRSGTSCSARALQALGIDLGTNLLGPVEYNQKGTFEDNDLASINKQMFNRVVYNGERILDFLKTEIFISACNILKNRYKSCDNYGFKHPLTLRFLPFWQKVFENLNLNDSYVMSIRNPLCHVNSLLNPTNSLGDPVPVEKALIMWIDLLISGCELTNHKKRVIVDYDEMLIAPSKQLDRMSKALDLSHYQNEAERKVFCTEFLDKSLQHHKSTFENLDGKIFPICAAMYSLLLKFAQDDFQNEEHFMTEWQLIVDDFKKNSFIYNSITRLVVENERYERELEELRQQLTDIFECQSKSGIFLRKLQS